jgi:hypothetical protein
MPTDISDELLGHSGSYVDDRIVVTPSCFSKEIRFDRNRVRQMLLPSGYARVDMSTSTPCLVRSDGSIIRLIAGTSGLQPDERALRIGREGLREPVAAFEQPNRVRWVGNLSTISPVEVRETWVDSLNFVLVASSGRKAPPLARVPFTTRLLSNAVVNSKLICLIIESDPPLRCPWYCRYR